MLHAAKADGKRLYLGGVKDELQEKVSERTVPKAIHSINGVALRIDETDKRKRYLDWESEGGPVIFGSRNRGLCASLRVVEYRKCENTKKLSIYGYSLLRKSGETFTLRG